MYQPTKKEINKKNIQRSSWMSQRIIAVQTNCSTTLINVK